MGRDHQPQREAFSKARTHGFALSRFSRSCVDSHWHYHPEYELILIEAGSGIRSIGPSIRPYAAGDLCLIGANLPHRFGSHPRERRGARWTVVHFLPGRFGQPFWELPQNRKISRMIAEADRGLHFPSDAVPLVSAALQKIARAPSADFGTFHLFELLAALAAIRGREPLNVHPPDSPRDPGDRRLSDLLAWVDDQADNPELSLSAAASRLQVSAPAFCRFFRRHLGKTFRQYLNEVRVTRACSQLLHPDAPVSQIAFATGFNNLANFNRRFREITGCTPTDFRGGAH